MKKSKKSSGKLERMTSPVSGCYIPVEQAAQVWKEVKESSMSEDFKDGALLALGFLTVPAGDEHHGLAVSDFIDGFYGVKQVPAEVLSAARRVVEELKAAGIEVVECSIVRGNR